MSDPSDKVPSSEDEKSTKSEAPGTDEDTVHQSDPPVSDDNEDNNNDEDENNEEEDENNEEDDEEDKIRKYWAACKMTKDLKDLMHQGAVPDGFEEEIFAILHEHLAKKCP